MRIGIDIDGVVCDLMGSVLPEINRKYGTSYVTEDVCEWNPKGWVGARGEKIDLATEVRAFLSNSELVLSPELCENAKESLGVLAADGHSLVFITSRKDSKQIMADTAEWMRRQGIDIPIIHCPHKESIDVDVLIEDNFDIAKQVAEESRWVVLMRRPWNEAGACPSMMIPAYGWHGVVAVIRYIDSIRTKTLNR